MQAIQSLLAMAILAIGNGRPRLPLQHVSFKWAVFRVVEVEWVEFTLPFFLRDRAVVFL